MQFFIDSADPEQIRQAYSWGYVSGVTTNPSLAAKIDKPYSEIVQEILDIVAEDSSVSLEVIATEYEEMLDQGRKLASLDERVVVKLPCTPAGLRACSQLKTEDIFVNMTLVFSARQALLAAKAGAMYVSPFAGRLDDIDGGVGLKVIRDIVKIYDNYFFPTEVLFASVRNPEHVEEAALAGADIITAPFEILEDLPNHQLTKVGLEKFLEDWQNSGLELPA